MHKAARKYWFSAAGSKSTCTNKNVCIRPFQLMVRGLNAALKQPHFSPLIVLLKGLIGPFINYSISVAKHKIHFSKPWKIYIMGALNILFILDVNGRYSVCFLCCFFQSYLFSHSLTLYCFHTSFTLRCCLGGGHSQMDPIISDCWLLIYLVSCVLCIITLMRARCWNTICVHDKRYDFLWELFSVLKFNLLPLHFFKNLALLKKQSNRPDLHVYVWVWFLGNFTTDSTWLAFLCLCNLKVCSIMRSKTDSTLLIV